ncbi:hypothetical protein JYP51_09170 [Ponticoccus gilvus]|nr:hypothetical protein [Enemella evansiae]
MHDLIAITPLGGHEPRRDHHHGQDLIEVTDVALASVAARLGQEAAAAALVAEVTGAEAPAPGRASSSAFWMGPDQWMVEAPFATQEDLAREIAGKASGVASVTEQTDAWCRFDLKGDRLGDVLERVCNADVRRFTGGEAIRTAIEHLGCFLVVRAPGHFSVIGPRSSAGSLHHALLTGMHSAL